MRRPTLSAELYDELKTAYRSKFPRRSVPNGTKVTLIFRAKDPVDVWGGFMHIPVDKDDYVRFEAWAETATEAMAKLQYMVNRSKYGRK